MFASILGILDGALSAFCKVLDYFVREDIKQAGRNEIIIDSQNEALRNQGISNEIEAIPVPSDKHIILDGM